MDFSTLGENLLVAIPTVLYGIVLIIAAWIIAKLVKKAVVKGAEAANLDSKLVQWNVANTNDQAQNTLSSIAQVLYYLVWVLFLPGIFETFGLTSIAQPIRDMTAGALEFIPALAMAIIIFVIGFIVARLVKNLVVNLAETVNIDHYVNKFTGSDDEGSNTLANALGYIAFALVIIPIAIVGLETLGIQSITVPIVGVLDSVLAAIPNILVAAILVAVGLVIARVVGQLVSSLLEGTGINSLSKYVEDKTENSKPINFANIIGQVVAVVIGLFFVVEALNALNLEVLNEVGVAIIAYIPNVLVALIILGLGIFGGRFLGNFVADNTNSKWIAEIVKAIFAVFAVFMALDQLNFANNIVNLAFLFIIGGLSVAFALSFGLGGRDFAAKQLDKLDRKINDESKDNNNNQQF